MRGTSVLMLAVTAAVGVPLGGRQSPPANAVDAVVACRGTADSVARLACFDRTAEALVRARENGDVVILDRAEVQKTRRSLFGFTLPRIKLFGGGGDDEEELKELSAKAVSVAPVERDRWFVELDDGSRWQTIEPARFPPRSGQVVRIKRGVMGSYIATFNGNRSVRIKRVE